MSDSTPHWLDFVKSEPLTRDELSTFYQISTKHVGAYVDSLTGTERVGRRWRVLIQHLPPSYWVACGLISPAPADGRGLPGTFKTGSHTTQQGSDTSRP